jgi:predicted alpha/beta-hydrolase family hydrolase
MPTQPLTLTLPDDRTVDAVQHLPAGDATPGWVLVYAPGAGSNLHDGFGVYLCERLAEAGMAAVRFQFPYQQARSRRPDQPALLQATWRSAIEAARPLGARLAVGGRSMGGRIASMVVAAGAPVDALTLFAYPLRPPGRPDKVRADHLPQVAVPALFCSGTRDSFGTPEELAAAADLVPQSTLHLLEGADHGFDCLKSSGRTRAQVWQEAVDTTIAWLRGRPPSTVG